MSDSEQDKPTEQPKQVHLHVEGSDPEMEIFLIDGQFQLVARSVGRLDVDVEPGIYKIKCRTGAVTNEQFVIVQDDPITMALPRLQFASPAPLGETSKTHEYQMQAAAMQSKFAHVTSGQGSWIFVFVRDWTAKGTSSRKQNPAKGLFLEDENGNLVADLGLASVSDISGDPWAACNVAVNPGIYRLRLEFTPVEGQTDSGLEQAIVASPDWQTQVFLLQGAYGLRATDWAPDLAGGAILQSRGAGGFDPARADFRQTELARLGLTNRRQVVSQEVRDMLRWKVDNPMLGIFGAHLLLMSRQLDEDLFRTVVQNLRRLLGEGVEHPDVEALALHLESTGPYQFKSPPMLRRSWSLIVDATADRPFLIAPDSLAAKIWNRLWSAEPWLIWLRRGEFAASGIPAAAAAVSASEETSELEAALTAHVVTQPIRLNQPTSSSFKAVMQMQVSTKEDLKPADAGAVEEPASAKGISIPVAQVFPDDARVKSLVKHLGIPEGNLRAALNRVYSKTGSKA